MHNASTAQEVTIITPTARDFELRVCTVSPQGATPSDRRAQRWNDPNPMPPCPVPPHLMTTRSGSPSHDNTYPETFEPLPEQSVRTAFILDRFTVNCTIIYCSNDSLINTTDAMGRSFYDFVIKRDEELVRSWIDVIKSWGVNERGQPSDGGFGFGKFTLLVSGRDSRCVVRYHPSISHITELRSHRPPSFDSEHASDLPPVSRHRSRSHRSHVTHSPLARPGDSSTQTRDAPPRPARPRSGGGDFLRELIRERPSETHGEQRGWEPPPRRKQNEIAVDAIFSAHSDGVMVILRKSSASSPAGSSTGLTSSLSSLSPSQALYTFPPPPRLTRASRDDSSPSRPNRGYHSSASQECYYSP
jgi:hypothetical protein